MEALYQNFANYEKTWQRQGKKTIKKAIKCMSIYGISVPQLETIWRMLEQRINNLSDEQKKCWRASALPLPRKGMLMSSLCMCALACTWDQLASLQKMWLEENEIPVDERTLRRHWSSIALLIEQQPLMNPNVRFKHMHKAFPNVTCILDGTVIPCRERLEQKVYDRASNKLISADRAYSGKHHIICTKIEVWCTLDGVPFAVRGGVPGSWHDAKFVYCAALPLRSATESRTKIEEQKMMHAQNLPYEPKKEGHSKTVEGTSPMPWYYEFKVVTRQNKRRSDDTKQTQAETIGSRRQNFSFILTILLFRGGGPTKN